MYNENKIIESPRQISQCEECRTKIYDDDKDVYINDEGEYFCSLQCVLDHYGVCKSEDCLGVN